jgi:arylesterase/paraoxonase
MRVGRVVAVGGSIAALLLVLAAFAFFVAFRPLSPLGPHATARCKAIALGASAAYLQLDRGRGLLYLSYLDRRAVAEGQPSQGTVMLVDLAAPEPRPRAAVIHDPPGFRPAALSLYVASGAAARLFVISHGVADETIEILEQSAGGGFQPLATVRDALLVAPRAIVAVGPRAFYAANDPAAERGWVGLIDALLPRGRASLVYDDGSSVRTVVAGLPAASALGLSPDGRHLYLGEGRARRIAVYARDPASGALDPEPERLIDLGSMPSGLDVDPAGDLWVAAHPRALDLWRHLGDPAQRSPTQVLRISPRDWKPVEAFFDPGGQLSAGSAAVAASGMLLIGARLEPKLLRCALP